MRVEVGCSLRRFLGTACVAQLAAWALVGACMDADAGEGPPREGVPLVTDRVKRSLWEWDSAGRRDPFVFRQPKARVPIVPTAGTGGLEVGLPTQMGSEEPTKTPGERPDATQQRLQVKKLAEELAARAFGALGRQEYAKVEEFVAGALNRMRALELDDPESRSLGEKLLRLYNTAGRLKKRAETEAQFRNLKIVIKGIVWQPVNPVAVINDTVVTEGDVVLGARVEEIRPGEVIFNLKGVRVSRSP